MIAENILVGALNLSDTIRDESYDAVKLLRNEGIKMWMMTGDNESSAKSVSDALKLDGYFAGVLPHQKQEKVKEVLRKIAAISSAEKKRCFSWKTCRRYFI